MKTNLIHQFNESIINILCNNKFNNFEELFFRVKKELSQYDNLIDGEIIDLIQKNLNGNDINYYNWEYPTNNICTINNESLYNLFLNNLEITVYFKDNRIVLQIGENETLILYDDILKENKLILEQYGGMIKTKPEVQIVKQTEWLYPEKESRYLTNNKELLNKMIDSPDFINSIKNENIICIQQDNEKYVYFNEKDNIIDIKDINVETKESPIIEDVIDEKII